MRKLALPTMMAVVLTLVISPGWAQAQAGSLDPSWGDNGLSEPTSGFGTVAAVADDGRVYLSGETARYRGGQRIVAYDAAGALDPSFAPVVLPNQSRWDEWRIAVQPTVDGHRLLALNRGRIHGLTASGVSDSTFGQNGVAAPASTVVGGDVDMEVAEGGKRIVHLSTAHRTIGVVRSVGAIIYVTVGAGTEASGFVLSVFDENGAPDRSFGAAGVTGADTPGAFVCVFLCKLEKVSFVPKDAEIGEDGSIYVGGHIITETATDRTINAAIVKFRPDGMLDDSFGERGVLLGGPLGESSDLTALAEQPGHGLLAAVRQCEWDVWRYRCWHSNDIRRLTPEGALDTTFGESGITSLRHPVHGLDQIEVTADGTHIIAIQDQVDHETPETEEPVVILRLTAQGAVDTTFGSDGMVHPTTGGRGALDQTGRIYIPGSVAVSWPEYTMHIARYQATEGSSTDPSPGPSPTSTVTLATVTGEVYNEKTFEPIPGASIICDDYTATSGDDGWYELKIAPGTYHCTVSAKGYHDGKFRRDFKESCGCFHNFGLRPRH